MLNKGDILTIAGGHTGHVGARGCGYKEEILTKEVAVELTKMFNITGYKAYDVSPTGTGYTANTQLQTEVNNANKYNAKLHLCIHFNAFNCNANGTETWIYATGGNAEKYARSINTEMVKLGFANRGVKVSGNSLYVPRKTTAPCCLIEVCFIDNQNDMNKYNLKKTCEAIYKACTGLEYSSNTNTSNTVNSSSNGTYKVIVGSYGVKANAEKRQAELKEKGFNSFLLIESKDFSFNLYRVVCGSFTNKANAEKQKQELLNKGLDSFIEYK